jgi:hypothetical protein
MGTNYYATIKGNPCPTCGHDPDSRKLHIGKSSSGWCFALHVEPNNPNFPSNWGEWIDLLGGHNVTIHDEYDDEYTLERLMKVVAHRDWAIKREVLPKRYLSWDDFYYKNHAQPGPNGLLRHRIGNGCIAHGEGTWDLIAGYFS